MGAESRRPEPKHLTPRRLSDLKWTTEEMRESNRRARERKERFKRLLLLDLSVAEPTDVGAIMRRLPRRIRKGEAE